MSDFMKETVGVIFNGKFFEVYSHKGEQLGCFTSVEVTTDVNDIPMAKVNFICNVFKDKQEMWDFLNGDNKKPKP